MKSGCYVVLCAVRILAHFSHFVRILFASRFFFRKNERRETKRKKAFKCA